MGYNLNQARLFFPIDRLRYKSCVGLVCSPASTNQATRSTMMSVRQDVPLIESDMSRVLDRLSWAMLILVLLVSLLLRVHRLDLFLTIDEPLWHDRSIGFSQSLSSGDYAATYRAPHPGVITMWSGVAATRIVEWQSGEQAPFLGEYEGLGLSPVTVWARRIIALMTWAGIVALFFLSRRLWGQHMALLATVIIALDPFYLALSRVHHLDGLLTTFMMLSVVSLISYLTHRRSAPLLILSGVMAGLAVANKAPGAFMAPWAALAIGWVAWRGGREGRGRRLLRSSWILLAWGSIAALTFLVVWPALWTDPLGTLLLMVEGALGEGTQPHSLSNYFAFMRRDDPGLAFYPVAWAFRTTAPVILGLLALVFARRHRLRGFGPLVLFILLYGLFMTVSPKKFDRYLLPIFPPVNLLAAAGLAALLERARALPWARARSLFRPALTVGAVAVVAVTQMALLWPARPYYFSYYNPLAGGPEMAPHILLVGWGEAVEQAAHFMNEKPDAQDLLVATDLPNQFAPHFVGTTRHLDDQPVVEPDYFVFYLSHDQRDFFSALRALFDELEPGRVFGANGIDYVRLFRNQAYWDETEEILYDIEQHPYASEEAVIANINATFHESYDGPLTLAAISGPEREDYLLTQLWPIVEEFDRVWLLNYPDVAGQNGESTERLADILDLYGDRADYVAVNGVEATYYILAQESPLVPRPTTPARVRLGDVAILTGWDLVPSEVQAGGTLSLRLHWHSQGPTQGQYKVFTHLLGPDGEMYGQADSVPQGGAWPTVWWQPGQQIVDDYEIAVSADAPPGEYTLALGMYEMDTLARLPVCTHDGGCREDGRLLIKGLRLAAP